MKLLELFNYLATSEPFMMGCYFATLFYCTVRIAIIIIEFFEEKLKQLYEKRKKEEEKKE